MRGAQPSQTNRARVLRSRETSAEEWMWTELRNRRLKGLKFVRQFPIGPYFADFACRDKNVIVEVDGGTHSTPLELENDQRRSRYFEGEGCRVFRVDNDEVYENRDGVLDSLLVFVEDASD